MTETTRTTVGIGGAAESTDMVLNIGPQHPPRTVCSDCDWYSTAR